MARKTNKTAHVLNLISKAKDEHQSMEEQMQIDSTGSDVSNDLLFMGIEPSNDKSISEKINENLESLMELEEDLSTEETTTQQNPLSSPGEDEVIQDNALKASLDTSAVAETTEEEKSTETGIQETESTEPSFIETEKTTETVPSNEPAEEPFIMVTESPAKVVEPTFHYINVYENLVVERLEEFQQMFDVCTCPRCTADIIALALTKLPAKYIVSDNSKTIPLLSFYREKFRTSVAAQLSSACIVVKENPYH